ncbi:MMPL family transporter [bacterium]|jgi:uncharacterized protein|nr:MMPL family transporter [Planctomicrobium sp.]MDB4731372.1 MMPL family transporter [bacterium]
MSQFYRQFGRHLAVLVLVVLPFLTREADSLPSNNDIETWLPVHSETRNEYEYFKSLFGGEEVILVGVPNHLAEPQLIEAVASRIEGLEGIHSCWSPERFISIMGELGVSEETATERITGLVISKDQKTTGLVAKLSEEGLKKREQTVSEVKQILAYSQLSDEDILLSGAPVIVAELNELGSRKNSKVFFLLTLAICFTLLLQSTRHWRLSTAILLITIFAIQATLCMVKFWSGEMNFILSALPVMVMVFTMATTIHLLHYYESSKGEKDRLGAALSKAWKPCALATFTTAIGLISLMVSEIVPVQQFGLTAAFGAMISCLCGLGLTPIALVLWPEAVDQPKSQHWEWATRFSFKIVEYRKPLVVGVSCLLLICMLGLPKLASKVDPLDFLPRDSDVVHDFIEVEKNLTNVDSFEAIIDFGVEDLTFPEKLSRIKLIERGIALHENVQHTFSLASFFPERMPDSGLEMIQLLSNARSSQQGSDYVSAGERYWRISARIQGESTDDKQRIFLELKESLKGEDVLLTGMAPLVKQAQDDIFAGFWESFATALLIIAVVMMVALGSIRIALLAMIPNLTPLFLVFGILGWIEFPVDIGMMMTASIALGIAVDGTFHFLVAYRENHKKCKRNDRSSLLALLQTGQPIFVAAVIASVGMLALSQSRFVPTVRFGVLMSVLLLTAVFSDLVLLPALLALKNAKKKSKSTRLQPAEESELSESRIAA